ncbi:hypothetical protein Gohar_027852, partial [Gossypium harknessii]|nr:hypothetical protein [Gossypium harknessii]
HGLEKGGDLRTRSTKEELASLSILDDEEDLIQTNEMRMQWRRILGRLWHPLGVVSITDIGEKRSLFQFYHELDLKRVLQGMPWFFNRHLILFYQLVHGEDSLQVPLVFSEFWVQVHNSPMGIMSKGMARQFGNFIGQILDYDAGFVIREIKSWDISLRAAPKRASSKVSWWLRDDNYGSVPIGAKECFSWAKKSSSTFRPDGNGQMELGLDIEDNLIEIVDSKKRQRMYQLLLRRSTKHNEDPQLECPWVGIAMKTKTIIRRMEMVRNKYGFMNEIEVEVVGLRGGLSLGWTRDYSVQLRSYSKLDINVEVCKGKGMSPQGLTGFYGAFDERFREESWDLICQLNGNSLLSWLVIGDFNEIVFFFKKRGARV